MAFLDQSYLLPDGVAREIYESIQGLPILDAHNHCDVKALSEDRKFENFWEAEAATDHYVWECLRKCGVDEALLTGKEASDKEKFLAFAANFELVAGNPTYEWIHLDLKRRLGIDLEINAENAEAIWSQCEAKFAQDDMSQQNLIKAMNVEAMCSTDDPADTLEYHQALQNSQLKNTVFPTFRPDKAMNIGKPEWNAYIDSLGKRWNTSIETIDQLFDVLGQAHAFFASLGCRASDHGVNVPYAQQFPKGIAEKVFAKARAGEKVDYTDRVIFMSYFLNEVAELDAQRGWVFQLHIGAVRDVRTSLYETLGPDVGGDLCDHNTDILTPILPLLNRFDNRLKVVLYNMNPIHNATLAQLTRVFGNKVSLGLAWWLNDSYIGMKRQLEYAASVDLLSNMAGMVSDSRKILSYGSRHEVFRRTLSNVLSGMVGLGQMSKATALKLARRLAYDRPKELFGF